MSDKNRRNYYRILHVQPDSPTEIIKASYRTLMQKLKYHPDLGGDEWNATVLNEAYDTLRDPAKREAYDKSLFEKVSVSLGKKQDEAKPRDVIRAMANCQFCHTAFSNLAQTGDCHSCHSPRETTEQVQGEGRVFERLAKTGPIAYYTQWPQSKLTGLCQDLTPQGMRFWGNESLSLGAIIKIDSPICHAIAKVSNCSILRDAAYIYQVGVVFVSVRFPRQRGNFLSTSV